MKRSETFSAGFSSLASIFQFLESYHITGSRPSSGRGQPSDWTRDNTQFTSHLSQHFRIKFFFTPLKKPFPRPFALVGFGALPDKVHEILLALQEVYQLFGKREFINDDNSDELINIPDG